jgi:1,4-dihydroxy-6-naphthoate synthase
MAAGRTLSIAYTPDSDDAFYYDALESERVVCEHRLRFYREPIAILNRKALEGVHDVTAVSSVVYPLIACRYAILSAGTSVGRGYGPVLISRERKTQYDLSGARVGVGGIPSTGWFLLRRFCLAALPIEMPFDLIAEAVAQGELEAGVMIHEELLYYRRLGLHKVVDLGAAWCDAQGMPIPVGLNVIRRDLGPRVMTQVCSAIRQSLQFGLDHQEPTLRRVSRFGRGARGGCTEEFVRKFANQDSLDMPADVRSALAEIFRQVVEQGICAQVPPLDIVEAVARDVETQAA